MVPLRALVALLLVVASAATAQPGPGFLRADVVYAPLVYRSGSALYPPSTGVPEGFPIGYAGFAPSYFRASGTWYPAGFFLGATADLNFDTFVVRGDGLTGRVDERVYGGALTAGASGRLQLNPTLGLEAQVGLGFSAAPFVLFDPAASGNLSRTALAYLGPVFGLSGRYSLPTYALEVRVRSVPFALAAGLGGEAATARQLTLGLQGAFAGFGAPGFELVPVAGYELSTIGGALETEEDVPPAVTTSQIAHRVFIGLRLQLGEAMGKRTPTGPGSIRGRVLADSGELLPGATIRVVGTDLPPVVANSKAEFRLPSVPPGPVVLEVSVAGYRVLRHEVTLSPETELLSSVEMVRKTGPGRIVGTAYALNADGSRGAPLAGAQVEGPDAQFVVSDAKGTFTLQNVGPGLVTVFIRASGYTEVEEVVDVPPEADAELEVTLAPQKQKALASLRGLVRSVAGKPIAAALRIPEAKVTTRAGTDGRFVVRLPGGRYTVVFSAPGFVSQTKVIQVADGDQALFYVDLSPEER